MNTKDKFFMVWCPQAQAPTKQHWSRESAIAEAKRLARANSGKEFIVLEAVTSFQVADLIQTAYDSAPF